MSHDTIAHTLASAVANAGTVVVAYPTGKDAGDYALGYGHKVSIRGIGLYTEPAGIAITLGTDDVTVTNNTGVTWPAGTPIFVQLDQAGGSGTPALADPEKITPAGLYLVSLGAPDTADPNGVVETQAATLADGLATGINGALAEDDVATFDVPRNCVAAWTGTAVLTVSGTDAYGQRITESSGSGTSLAGKKAFKTVDSVTVSANVTGLTVGTGDVLGLPVFLPAAGRIIKELQGGAAATAGTPVAGVRTVATATTGDVRGTYDPNAACNGALAFSLLVALDNPGDKGVAQFAA